MREPQNLTQVLWGEVYKAATLCLWTAYQCAQKLLICLIWMWEAFEVTVTLNNDIVPSF